MKPMIQTSLATIICSAVALAQEPTTTRVDFAPTPQNQIHLGTTPVDLNDLNGLKSLVKISALDFFKAAASWQVKNPTAPTVCNSVSNPEVPSTYFCISTRKKDQNAIFSRASVYSEGNAYCSRPNTLVPTDHPSVIFYDLAAAGHNLMSDVLDNFFREISADSQGDCQATPDEQAFYDNVLSKIPEYQQHKPFAVITGSSDLGAYLPSVISHEALHAQYFINENVQLAVESYWTNHLREEERQKVIEDLGKAYDVTNDFVLKNEFFAYTVQVNEEQGQIPTIAPKHKAQMIDHIERESGIKVFQITK